MHHFPCWIHSYLPKCDKRIPGRKLCLLLRLKIMWSSWPIGRYFFQLFMRVTVRNESNTGQNIRSYEVYLFCVTQCALSTYTYGFHVGWSVDSVWPASTEPGWGLWITCWRLLRHQLQPRWKVERDVSTRSKTSRPETETPKGTIVGFQVENLWLNSFVKIPVFLSNSTLRSVHT